jgi:hypothetical protein
MNDENVSKWPKYATYSFLALAFLIIILILFLFLIHSPLIFKSGASSLLLPSTTTTGAVTSSVSIDNSYVFASPLRAKTGGEQIRITVYVLDSRGLGVAGKQVTVGGGSSLQVTPVQPTTDSQGRATFDVSSDSPPGVYVIQASVDGQTLTQEATISFD